MILVPHNFLILPGDFMHINVENATAEAACDYFGEPAYLTFVDEHSSSIRDALHDLVDGP